MAGSAFGLYDDDNPPPGDGMLYWWSGTLGDSWNILGSWWDDRPHLPGPNDVPSIDNPLPTYCLIDSNVTDANAAVCLELHVGDYPANSGEVPLVATLDVNGGTLTVGEDVLIGLRDNTRDSDYAIGDFNVISGTVNIGRDLFIGREGIGKLNMRGGSLTVGGTIWCPGGPLPEYTGQTYDYGTGQLTLYGGTIEANDLMSYDEDDSIGQIDIAGGTLILNGDKRSSITDLMNQGRLYQGGGGDIVFDYNDSNPGKTTVISVLDPNCAKRPDPGNYARDVSLTTDLTWESGINVNDVNGHEVYFGTTFEDVNEANNTPGVWPEFKGNQDSNTYDPCTGELAAFTTYYWRIDEVNDPTTWRGNVWRFTTVNPYIASNPAPADKAKNVAVEVVLEWDEGIAANSHDVYFGTSFNEVNESSTPTATLVGDSNTSYAPSPSPEYLLLDETYYWRVDEVNTVTSTTWRGPVWKFTTRPYKLIEDFEYGYPPPLSVIWVPAGGATVDKVTDSPFNDTNAMELGYDNGSSPWDSNATFSISSTKRNWVSGGVEILRIPFHGTEDNAVEQLYVTVKDSDGNSATVLYSDSNNIVQWSNELWRLWSVDIGKFTGVNREDVRKLTIGLGDGASPGGEGAVYFDDIGLYRPMCLNQDGDADLNNDCAVDIDDIELLVDDWLKSGYDVNAGTASDTGLVLHYKFDEGSGTTATDSAAPEQNGKLYFPSWKSPGYGETGSCVWFVDQLYIDVPVEAASVGMGGHSTVALWIKDDGVDDTVAAEDIGTQLFQVGPSSQGNIQAFLSYNGYFAYVCGWNDENNWQDQVTWGEDGYNNPEHPLGQWVHYAFVKDATEGVMRIYQNGKIVAELSGTTGLEMPSLNPEEHFFTIGAWQWEEGTGGYYYGLMDEFRLYDRALSQQEIMDLADVSSLHQPVVSSAEVIYDDTVNFEDYAVTAAEWLEEPLLWP